MLLKSSAMTQTYHLPLHSFPTRRSSDLWDEPADSAEVLTPRRLSLCVPGLVWDEVIRRSEEHTSELESHVKLVCGLLLENRHPGDTLDGTEMLVGIRSDCAGAVIVNEAEC